MAQIQNIVVCLFKVESEAYQALTELKQNPGGENSYVAAAALIKKENGAMKFLDGFDTGSNTSDDTAKGGLIGGLIGILGGPIGILLGGSLGMLIGSTLDTDDALLNASMLEQITGKMEEGEIAIIGLAFEESEEMLDRRFIKFDTVVARFDAAAVAAEVEEAQKMADEMARQARQELRNEKKEERKEKKEEKKAKLNAEWEGVKSKFKKDKKEEEEK